MVAAMIAVTAELGASEVTVGRVVARSGVSRRTFYEIFEDSEDCFLAAVEEALSCASKYVRDAYDPKAPWPERMRGGLTALLSFLEEEPDMGRLLMVETLGAGPKTLRRRSEAIEPVLAAVDAGRLEGRNGSGPSSLSAEGVVGAVMSVLHTRMVEQGTHSLIELANPLMGIVVLPYLGPVGARKELAKPQPQRVAPPPDASVALYPFEELPMRLTYRTICVLRAIATQPGASNRQIADAAGVTDQGQMSKLLARLERLGLLANDGAGQSKGAPNAWTLTPRGAEVEQATSGPPDSGR
jgi:AcrR family transcriptional regulator